MKQPLLFILTGSLLAVSSMSLAAPIADQRATPIKRPSPSYPTRALKGMKEGWVKVSFVIDESGQVINPVITDSMGPPSLERAALKGIKQWQYQPAVVNGEVVQSCENKVQLDFKIQQTEPGASIRAVALIRDIRSALENNDQQAFTDLLQQLEDKAGNFYEFAYLHYFKAVHAELNQQVQQQINSLRLALETYHHPDLDAQLFYLGDAGYPLAANLFTLLVGQGRYAEAIALFDTVQYTHNADSQEAVAVMSTYVDRINAFDGHIPVDVTLSRRGTWLHPLVRQSFTFANVEGKVDSLEIRCDNHYEQFEFAIDNQWNIPQSWGACSVLLKGTAEAKVRLVEVGS